MGKSVLGIKIADGLRQVAGGKNRSCEEKIKIAGTAQAGQSTTPKQLREKSWVGMAESGTDRMDLWDQSG